MHREDLEQVLVDLRSRPVSAIIVSVARYQQQHAPHMARLVREFPRVPAVALLTANEARTTQALLSLGHQGCVPWSMPVTRRVAGPSPICGPRDSRQHRSGRHATHATGTHRRAPLMSRVFDALFTVPTTLTTVRQLARMLGVMPTTFMSRFFRNGLPAPKKYLALARLVRAAALLENPGYSITQVALLLESTPRRRVSPAMCKACSTAAPPHSGAAIPANPCCRTCATA